METQYSEQKQPRPVPQDASLKEKIEDNSKWSVRVSGNYLLTAIQISFLLLLLPDSTLRQHLIGLTSTKKDTVFVAVPTERLVNRVSEKRKVKTKFAHKTEQGAIPIVKVDTTIIVVQAPTQHDAEPTFLVLTANGRKYTFRRSTQVGDSIIYEAVPRLSDSTTVTNSTSLNNTLVRSSNTTLVTQVQTNVPKSKVQAVHRVGPGDILRVVAGKYGITLEALMKANGLKRNYITQGTLLIIPYP